MSEDDMANYLLSEDEDDRPKVVSVPRSEESKEKSREKRESKKHYAMMPDGSINGHYTNDFHNDHVTQEERDNFKNEIKELAFQERGFDEERSLYRGEANNVGEKVLNEIKRRTELRKGDLENAQVNKRPQVEDVYDALRDIRDFGPPEDYSFILHTKIDKERTDAIVKEALSRFPTDWLKDCKWPVDITIMDCEGRACCMNGRVIYIYTKQSIGEGNSVENNDRALVNQLAHELGHYVEAANEKVRNSTTDCLISRGRDSKRIEIEPGYDAWEDSFFNAYMGKLYSSGDTEILSVLMENIGSFDPLERIQGKEYHFSTGKFGRKVTDKESLGYILGVLAGL